MLLDQLARIAVTVRKSGRRSRLQKADQRFKPSEHVELEEHLKFLLLAGSTHGERQSSTSEPSEIQTRLIRCNLKRRNRFLYAQQHSIGLHPSPAEQSITLQVADKTRLETISNPNTSNFSDREQSSTAWDGKTGTSASAVSDTFTLAIDTPTAPVTAPIPSAAAPASTIMSGNVVDLDYPQPPKVKEGAHFFRCPCCCQTLPVSFREHNKWR